MRLSARLDEGAAEGIGLQYLAAPIHHIEQCRRRDADRKAGLLAQVLVEAVELAAAARQQHAVVHEVARQIGGRLVERVLDGLRHLAEGLLKGSIPGRRTILFNGAEAFSAPEILKKLKYPDDVRVLLASEKEGKIYETIR